MQSVFALIQQVAPSRAAVLITGESGTGKELAARAIHSLSKRASGPFVAINSSAIPESLMESELFGHEKGSFTGALGTRSGCFEMANHGTLLLDEIAEMPLALQDRTFNLDGSLWFPTMGINPMDHPYWMPEFFGNTIMVNGQIGRAHV